jgi:hypothetical protein
VRLEFRDFLVMVGHEVVVEVQGVPVMWEQLVYLVSLESLECLVSWEHRGLMGQLVHQVLLDQLELLEWEVQWVLLEIQVSAVLQV